MVPSQNFGSLQMRRGGRQRRRPNFDTTPENMKIFNDRLTANAQFRLDAIGLMSQLNNTVYAMHRQSEEDMDHTLLALEQNGTSSRNGEQGSIGPIREEH